MKLYLRPVFLQKRLLVVKFITVIVASLSQTLSASPQPQTSSTLNNNICAYTLSITSFLTEELKDTIEVAKVIAFIRNNKNTSTQEDITIHPIDIFLASMTTVVETDNHTYTVKADITTGGIFNSLKSLNEGLFLLNIQNTLWEKLDDPVKEQLQVSEPPPRGYTLTLDRRYQNPFDSITSRDAIFDQASMDLLQQAQIESNEGSPITHGDILLAMIQSHDLHFINELIIRSGVFDTLPHRNQRYHDQIKFVINTTHTNTTYRYTSIQQLQVLHHISRRNNRNGTQQFNQEDKSVNIDSYLLSRFGFSRRRVGQLIPLIESNNFDELRIKIKKHILGNTSSEEIEEMKRLNNTDIEVLVDENDIRNFLKYIRNFTDEESEFFIQKFIREKTTQTSISHPGDYEVKQASTTQMSQQPQELLDRLRNMDQNALETFIRKIGFEINNNFINHLMDPKKVPQNIKRLFLRFIANIEQAGSISNMRISHNTHGFKKIRVSKRNKRNQRHNYYSLHLDSGDWIVVLKKQGDIFVLDQIMSHNTYNRHF